MLDPNSVLLLVDSPAASAAFYAKLLGRAPVESSPTFALFALKQGLMLGLWSKHTVEPAFAGQPGASEICFSAADAAEVRATHAAWNQLGAAIAQSPVQMDFGYTFVALDPDGHRLRVYVTGAP
jgi:predicted enzyme related to lactoylglutathione lyase